MDHVRPLKYENTATGGTSNDYLPTEVNPAQDYVATKGILIEDSESYRIDKSSTELQFTDSILGTKTPSQLKILEIPIFGTANPYLDEAGTTFKAMARFLYRGTTELNAPTTVRAIVQGANATSNNEIRLFNVTNSVILGTAGYTSSSLKVATITTSNWPTNIAIIEVQLRNIAGGAARVSGISLEW